MSAVTKEQILRFAAAWQAVLIIVPWYMNEFGVDTINRLIGWIALLVIFVIVFLNKDDTAKVAVAVGTIEKFIGEQKQDKQSVSDSLFEFLKILKAIERSKEPEKEEPEPEIGDFSFGKD